MTDIIKAHRKIILLKFPAEMSGKPVVYNLARRFDLTFNILTAQITPRKEGHMTLELCGTEENYAHGISYLKEHGITISDVAQRISRAEDSCIHCGMCTAVCPGDALHIDPVSRQVIYDMDRCTACGLCVRVCPVRAMQLEVENGHW